MTIQQVRQIRRQAIQRTQNAMPVFNVSVWQREFLEGYKENGIYYPSVEVATLRRITVKATDAKHASYKAARQFDFYNCVKIIVHS